MSIEEKKEVRSLVGWWMAQTWFDLRPKRRIAYTRRAILLVCAK